MMSTMPKMPGVGVGIIIRIENKVLLLRRKNVHGSGSWSTPGGHLDFQETPEECAIREAKEETNLNIQNPQFVAITNDVFQSEEKHYITLWMEANHLDGEAVLNAPYESDAIGWFSWNNLPQPLFIPFQHLLQRQSYASRSILSRYGVIEKLYKVCEALEKRFPGNRDPFRILARLMEESGELADQVHLWENIGRKRASGREPNKDELAKEIKQVILAALDLARYYGVENQLEQSIAANYERAVAEGLIETDTSVKQAL